MADKRAISKERSQCEIDGVAKKRKLHESESPQKRRAQLEPRPSTSLTVEEEEIATGCQSGLGQLNSIEENLFSFLDPCFKRMADAISAPENDDKETIAFLEKMVRESFLSIVYTFEKAEQSRKNKRAFRCLIFISDILVGKSDPFPTQRKAKAVAAKLALKKLRSPKFKIIKNLNEMVLVTDHRAIDDQLAHCAPEPQAIPNPNEDYPTKARLHFLRFVVVENAESQTASPVSIIHNSADANNAELEFVYAPSPSRIVPCHWRCFVMLSEHRISEGIGETTKDAKKAAALSTLMTLKSVAYTLVVKRSVLPLRTILKEEFSSGDVQPTEAQFNDKAREVIAEYACARSEGTFFTN